MCSFCIVAMTKSFVPFLPFGPFVKSRNINCGSFLFQSQASEIRISLCTNTEERGCVSNSKISNLRDEYTCVDKFISISRNLCFAISII